MTAPYILKVGEGQVTIETAGGMKELVLNNCTFLVFETSGQAEAVLQLEVVARELHDSSDVVLREIVMRFEHELCTSNEEAFQIVKRLVAALAKYKENSTP